MVSAPQNVIDALNVVQDYLDTLPADEKARCILEVMGEWRTLRSPAPSSKHPLDESNKRYCQRHKRYFYTPARCRLCEVEDDEL